MRRGKRGARSNTGGQNVGSEKTQSFTERSNVTETHIGGASGGYTEKGGQKEDSVQSIEKKNLLNRRRKVSIYA